MRAYDVRLIADIASDILLDMLTFLIALLMFSLPGLILWFSNQFTWAKKLGAIILCYLVGLLLGNSGIIPESMQTLQSDLSEVSVALALPMLLFSLNVKQWSSMAGKAMLSLILATTSVVAVATSFYFLYADTNAVQSSHLAAMSVGVYTGGTANLAAIKSGLGIADDLYLLFHSFDTLLGGIYLLFMLSVAIPFFRWLLPYQTDSDTPSTKAHLPDTNFELYDDNYTVLLKPKNYLQIGKVVTLSTLILGLSLFCAGTVKEIFNTDNTAAVTILCLTSFAILLSLRENVRQLYLSYKIGMYLILIFCIVVASMADIRKLGELNVTVAIFLFGTMISSLIMHALLCKIAKIDSDTFMVTSVSAICSPPFVPLMAKALGNRNSLLSGMTTGIIGFAVGNYLGISLALFLQSIG